MIYLFNTNIVPGAAVVRVSEITAQEAKEMLNQRDFVSAIGHEATAQAFGQILGREVPVNRINAQPSHGDTAITLKVNGRLPEGQILDLPALQEMGFALYRMDFYSPELVIVPAECSTSSINC